MDKVDNKDNKLNVWSAREEFAAVNEINKDDHVHENKFGVCLRVQSLWGKIFEQSGYQGVFVEAESDNM